MRQLLYVDGTAETREHLQHTVSEFEKACGCMGLKINVGKSEVLIVIKDQTRSCEKVRDEN